MEKELIVVAKREAAHRNLYGPISTFILFSLVLIFDIVVYTLNRATWQLILLIIVAVLDLLALLALLFAISHLSYSKKVLNKPLIVYDSESKEFIVTDCFFHKEIRINKDDVIEIKVNDSGDTYLWHKSESRKTSTFIGYSSKANEDLINNEMQKYKNIYY